MKFMIFWLIFVGIIVGASVGAYFLVKRLFTKRKK